MITARFNGRIEKLFVNKTGDYIRKVKALLRYTAGSCTGTK